MKKNAIVVINGCSSDSWPVAIWSDFQKIDYHLLGNPVSLNTGFQKTIYKIMFSNKLNRFINVPFKSAWNKKTLISNDFFDSVSENYLFFQSCVKVSPSFIKRAKEQFHCHAYLYLPDTISAIGLPESPKGFIRYLKRYHIDKAISFDPVDSAKYQLIYFDIFSSSFIKEIQAKEPQDIKWDLFYVGTARNNYRVNIIQNLVELVASFPNKIKSFVKLIDKQNQSFSTVQEMGFTNGFTYSEMIKHDIHANCLLEILNPGQHGTTLRTKEAILLNKKLLTNNTNIVKSRFYDSRFIKIFHDVSDIDLDWVSRRENVNYHYHDEMSPLTLLNNYL